MNVVSPEEFYKIFWIRMAFWFVGAQAVMAVSFLVVGYWVVRRAIVAAAKEVMSMDQ